MKRLAIALVVAVSFVGSAGVANADLGDYLANPGYQQSGSVSCNSGHGAFEIFRGERGGWVPGEAQQGGIGDTTGPANSGAAASCRAQ
jgi:hypothetical protein